jgi:NAD(P)-dependent dehydrogenase (short-subunit alcohol dehydrogenase family)
MPKMFEGEAAVVTGGASGIGRATSLAFAGEGAAVMVADVDAAGGEATCDLVREAGGEARFVKADVARDVDVRALVEATVAAFGRLDIAFNNAAINDEEGPLTECSEERWGRILDVNLKGVFLCLKHEIPEMARSGGGAIVNAASVVGLSGSRGTPAYVASKHGIVGATRAAARDHAKDRVRVNAVCPGTIRTPMYVRREGDDATHDAQVAAAIPLGRLGEAEDVANAVLWLCSEGASFITGQTLVVDGGETA